MNHNQKEYFHTDKLLEFSTTNLLGCIGVDEVNKDKDLEGDGTTCVSDKTVSLVNTLV